MSDLATRAAALAADFHVEAAVVLEAPSREAIEKLRLAWLGRKGSVTLLFEEMKSVDKAARPLAGKAVNGLRQTVEAKIAELKEAATSFALAEKLARKPIDISLPVQSQHPSGALHPVTLMRSRLIGEFKRLGFASYDGPEIDFDFYNFSALNIPEHHPARDMQDTFFVKGRNNLVLRTHTSNIQIHAMLKEKPPLRLIAPGRVFRVDSDATHTPMFHQIECVVVDQGMSFAHLKGLIDSFMKAIFGGDLQTRFRPSFFPFVEPGAEVDLQCTICRGGGCKVCKQTGWLEVGGCGMIHPNVFEAVQYDSEIYTGFAFGFGIDRMAMLAYGLPDLRQMFEGDYGFHAQFPIFA